MQKMKKKQFQLGQNDVNKSIVHVRKMGHLCTKRDTCAQNGTLFSDTFFNLFWPSKTVVSLGNTIQTKEYGLVSY